ncbi:hypothetical protein JJB09_04605 [Rhizobium sp. KVB221]|uniref:DUF945 domain-containing protein n=1 Tax=Rhizobium setariae TaxID=2801340 RepID=A0A937CJN6_9HYPH|nr:hypothetical protein [Rhizobium setariae]MBL0371300.1 hypothetical protein [Rhizobium setariae]
MKLNRSISLMLASTAFISIANAAFALDGNDVLAKLNALSSPNGTSFAAQGSEVDGTTVKLSGVTVTMSSIDNKQLPIGDVTLTGVTEEDGGYEIEKASFSDLNVVENGSGIHAKDIFIEGISLPAQPEPGTISSLMLAQSFHVGETKITSDNKEVASIGAFTADYKMADDESKLDMEAAVSDIKIDTSATPDPKAKEAIEALGLANLNGALTMKGTWTLADGKMDVTEYALDFENLGRLDVNFSISGYTLEFVKSLQEAMKAANDNPDKAAGQQAMSMAMMGLMQQLSYNGASIRYDDAGIAPKVLDYAGKQQGVDGKQFAQSIKGMLPLLLAQLNMPELQNQIVEAANAFLDDPKSIEVTAEPAQPMPFPQIMGTAMGNPADLAKTLNVQITAND